MPALKVSRLDQSRKKWNLRGSARSKSMISYTLTWENDVTSVSFRLMFLNKLADQDDARIKVESIGSILTEVEPTRDQRDQKV